MITRILGGVSFLIILGALITFQNCSNNVPDSNLSKLSDHDTGSNNEGSNNDEPLPDTGNDENDNGNNEDGKVSEYNVRGVKSIGTLFRNSQNPYYFLKTKNNSDTFHELIDEYKEKIGNGKEYLLREYDDERLIPIAARFQPKRVADFVCKTIYNENNAADFATIRYDNQNQCRGIESTTSFGTPDYAYPGQTPVATPFWTGKHIDPDECIAKLYKVWCE